MIGGEFQHEGDVFVWLKQVISDSATQD